MRKLAITLAVVAVVAVVAVAGLRSLTAKLHSLIPQPEDCTASVSGHDATLDPEQAENAALVTALAVRRGLPARAATIALATAMQESKLYNLEGGDRDSLGLFQQRPSQGWGSRAQVLDPVHATNAFYDALVRIHDYQGLQITVAAQKVQHSAFPAAYAQHEPDARALASALTGYSAHAFSCRFDDPEVGSGHPAALRKEVGSLFSGVVAAPVVRGNAATISVRSSTAGWAVAQYVVAEAQRLGVHKVSYAGWLWTTGKNGDWRRGGSGTAQQVAITLA